VTGSGNNFAPGMSSRQASKFCEKHGNDAINRNMQIGIILFTLAIIQTLKVNSKKP